MSTDKPLPPRPSAEEVDAALTMVESGIGAGVELGCFLAANKTLGKSKYDTILAAETLHLRARVAELEEGHEKALALLEQIRTEKLAARGLADEATRVSQARHILRGNDPAKLCRYSGGEKSQQPDLTTGKYRQTPIGEVVEVSNGENGQPHIVIHTTREKIKELPINILGREVALTVIQRAEAREGGEL